MDVREEDRGKAGARASALRTRQKVGTQRSSGLELRRGCRSLAAAGIVALPMAALLAGLGGCTQSRPVGSRSPRVPPTTQAVRLVTSKDAKLTVGVSEIPGTLDPYQPGGDNTVTRAVDSLVLPSPFVIVPPGTPQLDTLVATSATLVHVSPQTAVYQINPGAVWSDGSRLTVEDFVSMWQEEKDATGLPVLPAASARASAGTTHTSVPGATPGPINGYDDIASISAGPGAGSVTVVFAEPYSDWESLFAYMSPPPAVGAAGKPGKIRPASGGYTVPALSAGPYEVTSFVPGREVTLSTNPRWWGQRPSIREIVFLPAGAAGGGAAIGAGSFGLAYLASFGEESLLRAAGNPRLDFAIGTGSTEMQLLFNTTGSALTTDLSVRDGIGRYIDRAAVAEAATGSVLAAPATYDHYVPASVGSVLPRAPDAFASPSPGVARSYLEAAGLRLHEMPGDGGRGLWFSGAAPVTLRLAWDSADRWACRAAGAIVAELFDAGFNVQTVPVDPVTLVGTILAGGSYDLALMPASQSPFPTQAEQLYTPAAVRPGVGGGRTAVQGRPAPLPPYGTAGADWNGFYDPNVDLLFGQVASELNPASANTTLSQIDSLLWQDLPSLPLFREPRMVVTAKWLGGVTFGTDDAGGVFWDMASWYVTEAVLRNAALPPTGGRRSR